MFAIFFFSIIAIHPLYLQAQLTDCRQFPVSPAVGDTIQILTDEEEIVVRTDLSRQGEDRTVLNAICVDVQTAGFYRITTGVRYSAAQSNESFYLTILNAGTPADSVTAPTCVTNVGPFRVLQDVVGDTSLTEFDTIQDAGIFYFTAGVDTIVLNHYFNVQEQYPFFLNPPNILIEREDIESVHIFKFELKFVAENGDDFDVELSKDVLDTESLAPIDTVKIGQPFVYSLNVANVGPEVSRDVIVADFVPEHIFIDETSFNIFPKHISANSDTLVWLIDSLGVGESEVITFQATVNESGALPATPFNLVNLSRATSLCDADTASVSVTVVPPPTYDLILTKSVLPETALPGEAFNYTIIIVNSGPDFAETISLVDVISEFVLYSNFNVAPLDTTPTLQWQLGPLAPGANIEISYQGMVPKSFELPEVPFTRINRARITSLYDSNPANDTSSASVDIVNPTYDLQVTKSVNPETVFRGEQFEYTIRVENFGPNAAENISLSDAIPEFILVSNFVNPPSDTTASDTLKWRFNLLAPGETIAISYRGMVPENFKLPEVPFTRINYARVFSQFDNNPENDTTSAAVNIVTPTYDLSVTKSVNPGTVFRGEGFEYTIRVENLGPNTAEEVRLWDALPEFILHSNFVNPPLDSTVADTLRWAIGSLAFGESFEIGYRGVVPKTFELPVDPFVRTNQAMVLSEYDTNPGNNTASATVEIVNPAYDLALTKTVSPTTALQGERFVYNLSIENFGPDLAENITVWDIVPEMMLNSNFVNPPMDSTARDTLTWRMNSLAAGERAEFAYSSVFPNAIDLPERPFTQRNFARVFAEFDRNAANDTSSAAVAITAQRDCIVLDQNAFRPGAGPLKITFKLSRGSFVSINLYDITGYLVTEIERASYTAGTHDSMWDGKTNNGLEVGSGVYLIIFRSNTLECLEKVIVVR